MSIAFVAGGKLFVKKNGDEPAREIESEFGQSVQRRSQSIERKHSWKQEGRGSRFMGGGAMLWGAESNPLQQYMQITGISRAPEAGKFLYSLNTSAVAGVFSVEVASGKEHRVYHGADKKLEHLASHPDHEAIACSVRHKDGTASIALMRADGSEIAIVTEGDTIDLCPRWVPAAPRNLVFQSAGLGRDAAGNFAGVGPFGIQELDVESGDLVPRAEDPERDFLEPKIDDEGSLYFIARPYSGQAKPPSFFRMLLDMLLFPFRLLAALFGFLNFFTVRYTGKPLNTSGSARSRTADTRRMMELGNIVDADRAARRALEAESDDREDKGSVPSSWILVKKDGEREETIAKRVMTFDLLPDGGVVYSGGKGIFIRDKNGKVTKVSDEKAVTLVVAIT